LLQFLSKSEQRLEQQKLSNKVGVVVVTTANGLQNAKRKPFCQFCFGESNFFTFFAQINVNNGKY
jgi:hypothetical protein